MIRIQVIRENDMIKKITLKGHANYEDYGKDIVCAAVSATFLCTVNGILSIDEDSIQVTSWDDRQILDVIKNSEIIQKLLCNMLRCLESLKEEYPKNIKII